MWQNFNDLRVNAKLAIKGEFSKFILLFLRKKMNFISCGRGSPSFLEVSLLAVVARYDNLLITERS
jgi:hypothetical protein